MESSLNNAPTAAMLVIGDEILSGRTKDQNIGFLAEYLSALGIDLKEVRVVGDEEAEIVTAINALRVRYTYLFTTGGIGPTHDDITAVAVSKAFGLPCEHDEKAVALLTKAYASRNIELTESRLRMARMPKGAIHIKNPISVAPGFSIENVHVMAGVPKIMQVMMDQLAPSLQGGVPMLSTAIDTDLGEGTIGKALGIIQDEHPNTIIGSYPKFENGNLSTQIVVRSRDEEAMNEAVEAVNEMVVGIRG